jgi:hypothetical protein
MLAANLLLFQEADPCQQFSLRGQGTKSITHKETSTEEMSLLVQVMQPINRLYGGFALEILI